ncbi:SPOR domain-containing protein [Salisaeta longa]|uniref:SPOR domain-containing protein n=1 Tax=Salisaeta longa TaxID=503170 RepID=UPI000415261E|nr:SPOR domain-containing protein [Salisaeta longa]
MSFRMFSAVVLATSLGLLACSGPRSARTPADTSDARGPRAPQTPQTATVDWATYETFDPSRYPVSPPQRELKIRHRVPTRLMRGAADQGIQQTVQGYRIQVFSATDKQASEEFRLQVRNWWTKVREDAPQDVFPKDLPIVIAYGQPYYRVRIGAFADRQRASRALNFIRKQYPDAFLAQSTVTVTR